MMEEITSRTRLTEQERSRLADFIAARIKAGNHTDKSTAAAATSEKIAGDKIITQVMVMALRRKLGLQDGRVARAGSCPEPVHQEDDEDLTIPEEEATFPGLITKIKDVLSYIERIQKSQKARLDKLFL